MLSADGELLIIGDQYGQAELRRVSSDLSSAGALRRVSDTVTPDDLLPVLARSSCHDCDGGGVIGLAFNSDSSHALTLGGDGGVLCWDISLHKSFHQSDRASSPHGAGSLQVTQTAQMELELTLRALPDAGPLWQLHGVHHDLLPIARMVPPPALTPATVADKSSPDAVRRASSIATSATDSSTSSEALQTRLSALRDRLKHLLASNSEASSMEQLDRTAFALDEQLVQQLQGKAQQESEAALQEVKRSEVGSQLVSERIVMECVSSMEQRQTGLSSFDTKIITFNFPIPKPTLTESRRLALAIRFRQLELAEEVWVNHQRQDEYQQQQQQQQHRDLSEPGSPMSPVNDGPAFGAISTTNTSVFDDWQQVEAGKLVCLAL